MSSDLCREYRGALAAKALGRLDADGEIALSAHLDGCPECRNELAELTFVAKALPRADLSHVVGAQPEPATDLGDRVRGTIARERLSQHRRTRRRVVGALAIAAAIIVAVATFGLVGLSSSPSSGRRFALAGGGGATATATLRARDEGTQVKFHVSGLDNGDTYWLWLTDAHGARMPAGTFYGSGAGRDLVMTAGLSPNDVARVWVTEGPSPDHVVLDSQGVNQSQ
jgi:hypothetical protein